MLFLVPTTSLLVKLEASLSRADSDQELSFGRAETQKKNYDTKIRG